MLLAITFRLDSDQSDKKIFMEVKQNLPTYPEICDFVADTQLDYMGQVVHVTGFSSIPLDENWEDFG